MVLKPQVEEVTEMKKLQAQRLMVKMMTLVMMVPRQLMMMVPRQLMMMVTVI